MSAFINPTLRVLRSDIYRVMIERGWAWSTPYAVADLLCVIHGTSVGALGLSWGGRAQHRHEGARHGGGRADD